MQPTLIMCSNYSHMLLVCTVNDLLNNFNIVVYAFLWCRTRVHACMVTPYNTCLGSAPCIMYGMFVPFHWQEYILYSACTASCCTVQFSSVEWNQSQYACIHFDPNNAFILTVIIIVPHKYYQCAKCAGYSGKIQYYSWGHMHAIRITNVDIIVAKIMINFD